MNDIWFESCGVKLFAVESGQGRPLLLLHGGLATHQAVRLFAAPLSADYRLITPDLRASGRSHFAGELGWDLLADDVVALARHLGLDRAVIGGISFGAGVAIRVALRHPQLVERLVLLHPAFGGAELGLTDAQWRAMRAMDAVGSRVVADGIAAMFPLFDALPIAIRERARALVATYDPASVATSTRFMASGAQPFARGEELVAIDAPTLVVPGLDPEHPVEVARVFAQIPRATIAETTDIATAIEQWLR